MEKEPKLYIVHCVDTEGPLEETVQATFERLWDIKGIKLEPSFDTLRKLQRREIDLGGLEDEIADFVAPHRLAYLSRWSDIDEMVLAVTSSDYRYANADPEGNPYTFTWFVIDVVGYVDNCRRKAVGYHVVWDNYQKILKGRMFNDIFGWHFHTVPVGNHSLHYNTCWTNNAFHEEVLARRILERSWFPSLFRAGANIERNDLSFWLEQFIPFDYSCASCPKQLEEPGSMWDWRQAPVAWTPYHPDFYDYRKPGTMNRWLFRCVDVDTTFMALSEKDVEDAFMAVRSGKSAVLAYNSHDRRDLRPKIEHARKLIKQVGDGYPDVVWRYANAKEAAQAVCRVPDKPAPRFEMEIKDSTVFIRTDQPLFGPHPFVAIEEEGGVFFRDNPTIESESSWAYQLVRKKKTRKVGVAGSNISGNVGTSYISL